jgi:hypothetical protein
MAGNAAGSGMKKMWPPSNNSRRAPGMACAKDSLFAGGERLERRRGPETAPAQILASARDEEKALPRAIDRKPAFSAPVYGARTRLRLTGIGTRADG